MKVQDNLIIRKPLKLSTLIGIYFIILSILLGGALLVWTYSTSINLINTELEKSFIQRNDIVTERLDDEADRIDTALYEIRINKELLDELSNARTEQASEVFINYADKTARYKLDVLFISTAESLIWLDASSPFPDVSPVLHHISASNRDYLLDARVAHFRSDADSFYGIFKSRKLVLENGEVLGIATGGTILNNNFNLINDIRSKSKTPTVIMTSGNDIVISISDFEAGPVSEIISHTIDAPRHSDTDFHRMPEYNLIFTHNEIDFPGSGGLSIIMGLPDEVLSNLQQSYINSLYIISAIIILFLFSMFLLIRRLIYPSINNLLNYTERISRNEEGIAPAVGSVLEFNIIGSAMEKMVEVINKSQQELKTSERKLRSYIENAPTGIFVTDKTGRYIEVNRASEKITGYTADELLKMDIADITPPEDKERGFEHFQRLLEDGSSTGDVQFLRKDGSRGHWKVDAIKLADNLFLGFVSDISDRVLMEKKLRTSLKEKDVLLQEVHHRVKNNLQLIISLLQIEMQHYIGDSKIYKDTISRIRRFSVIYSKLYIQEDIANINIASLIEESMEEIVSMYSTSRKDVALKFDIPQPVIPIDKAIAMSLIVNELVTNSMKYAFDESGEISLSLHCSAEGEISKFVYADNGRGMQSPVVGFGTKLVSILTGQLGLEIDMTSDTGVCYNFRLAESEKNNKAIEHEILYVEDEFIIALSRIQSLVEMGYNVNDEIINSGEKVLEYLRTTDSHPSLILMDIGLAGEMTGLEAAREIRKTSDIPILFSSGYEDAGKLAEISEIKFSAYTSKTCSDSELKNAIDKLLDLSKS